MRDIKDIVGILMRVLDGGEVLPAELEELVFEADGELAVALNEAFIKLQEFPYDRDLRRNDSVLDRVMWAELNCCCLERIVEARKPIKRGETHYRQRLMELCRRYFH